MNSVLLWFGGLLAIVLSALFTVPLIVDWNLYRGGFEEQASNILGRDVRVTGAVNLRLLPTPHVSFEKVRISDVPVDRSQLPGEPVLRAERIELGLAVAALLRGAAEIRDVKIVRPDLRLRVSADGLGNWQTFYRSPSNRSYLPSELSFREVAVTGGRVSLAGPDGRELLLIETIDGDLEAPPDGGPVRFRGHIHWRGERRELRLSTSDSSDAKAIRVKAVMRGVASSDQYVFDGQTSGLGERPAVSGEITARLPPGSALLPMWDAAASPEAPRPEGTGKAEPQHVDIKAQISADGRSLRLKDISAAFERDGRPQLITAEATVNWHDGLNIDTQVDSRWLDFDKLASPPGSGAASSPHVVRPLEVVRKLAHGVEQIIPADGRYRGKFAVDQLSLGGDVVSAFALSVTGSNGLVGIERLQAGLPGGGSIDITGGTVTENGAFGGSVLLRAQSAARLVTWATRGEDLPALDADGPFLIAGRLKTGNKLIELNDIEAEIAGQPLKGGFSYRWDSRPAIALRVDAPRLDLSAVLPGAFTFDEAASRLGLVGNPGRPSTEHADRGALARQVRDWLDPKSIDIALSVHAGALQDGVTQLRDVRADVDVVAGRMAVRRLRFNTGAGAAVELSGDVAGLGTQQPSGDLLWSVTATDPAAVRAVFAPLPHVRLTKASDQELGLMLPLRLAGALKLDAASDAPVIFSLDGAARTNRVQAKVQVTPHRDGNAAWRTGPFETIFELDGPDVLGLLRLATGSALGPDRSIEAAAGAASKTGRLSLRVAGIPATRLLAVGDLEQGGLRLGGRGQIAVAADNAISGSAEVDVVTNDTANLLATVGGPMAGAFQQVPLAGRFGVVLDPDGTRIALRQAKLAGALVSGIVQVPAGSQPTIDARLETERLAVGALLTALTERSSGDGGLAAAAPAASQPWPDASFDTKLLGRNDLRLSLKVGQLDVNPGVSIRDAVISAELRSGKLEVSDLSGRALGGTVSSSWTLDAGKPDLSLRGELKLSNFDLAEVSTETVKATGKASASAKLEGRGLSARSLLQLATGRGEIQFDDVKLPGLSPDAVPVAIRAVLSGEGKSDVQRLRTVLREELARGELALGSGRIPIEIGAGAVKLAPLEVRTPGTTVTNRTTLDLATLMVDAEWRFLLKATAGPAERRSGAQAGAPQVSVALPPVVVVHVGPLGSIGRSEGQILADDLFRELSVRQMETDVAELERLRRQDEERVRQEAARRKAIEEAQARAAAAAGSAAALAPGPLSSQPEQGAGSPPVIYAPLPIVPGPQTAPNAPGGASQGATAPAPVPAQRPAAPFRYPPRPKQAEPIPPPG